MVGAINLLGRATTLLPPNDDARIALELDLGEALQEAGRLAEAEALLEQTAAEAARQQPIAQSTAEPSSASCPFGSRRGAKASTLRSARDLEPLVAAFEQAGDHRDAANALRLLGVLTRSRARSR